MISRSIIEEIKLLFTKKEYEAALKVANEKTKITERPAGLSNLLGLCKILKINRDKKDILSLSHGKSIENNKNFSNPIIIEDSHKRSIALCKIKDNMLIPIIDIGMYLRLE